MTARTKAFFVRDLLDAAGEVAVGGLWRVTVVTRGQPWMESMK